VHLLQWPRTDRLGLPGLELADLEKATLVNGADLAAAPAADARGGLELQGLPGLPADASVQVVRLDLRRVPAAWCRQPAAPAAPSPVAVSPVEPTRLCPEDAALEGRGAKGAPLRVGRDPGSGEAFLGGWMVPDQHAWWEIQVSRAGTYEVELVVRPPRAGQGGASLAVVAGADRVTGTVPDRGPPPALQTVALGQVLLPFQAVALGRVRLPAGRSRIALEPEALLWGYLLGEVSAVVLRPG
jgi:hypothetical protein